MQSKKCYFWRIMSERYYIIQSAWVNIYEDTRTRLIETHKQRVKEIHKH